MTMQHQESSTSFSSHTSTGSSDSWRHDASRAASILRIAAPLLADPLSMDTAVSKASDVVRHARALLERATEGSFEQVSDVDFGGTLTTAIGLLACFDYHAADYEMSGQLDAASVKAALAEAISLIESQLACKAARPTKMH